MSVRIYNQNQIDKIKKAGLILAETFKLLENNIIEGITTKELDIIAADFITSKNAIASCKGYNGYPASICTSINEELIHGIPGARKLKNGDILSIDIVVKYDGYNADATRTYNVGEISNENQKLIDTAKDSFFESMKYAREGYYISDISKCIQHYVESNGFSVIRDFVGHGVGRELHEPPEVPNYFTGNRGIRLTKGMVIAIEPMIAIGKPDIEILTDGWTVVMADNKNSAHYENTVIITDDEPEIVTF